MSHDKFQIVGGNLVGRGLSFSVSSIGTPNADMEAALVDVSEAVYKQGFDAARLSYDDRHDLQAAVETLRAVSVITGLGASERHRRASDIIARLLADQAA